MTALGLNGASKTDVGAGLPGTVCYCRVDATDGGAEVMPFNIQSC